MCKILDRSLQPFYRDDETYILTYRHTDRDYNFTYIDISFFSKIKTDVAVGRSCTLLNFRTYH